jgi:glutamine synthetase
MAPDKVNWSSAGESELIHIDTYRGQTRVELRSPDAEGNPYLVYALLIRAGLEGIREKLELPEEMEQNPELLPGSRKEASKLALQSEFVKQFVPEGLLTEYTKA